MTADESETVAWPVAALDPVARLRVLAAGLPGVSIEERRLARPVQEVWGFISDLERSIASFDRSVASVRVLQRDGTHLRIRARSTWRSAFQPVQFEVDLEPGWCWMVSRPTFYVVGMAAVADGDHTHYAQLEGFSIPWRPLRPLLRLSRLKHRPHVRSDLDGIERALTGR